jgi:beta-ureidopropionase
MNENISRRKFIENASIGLGASTIGLPNMLTTASAQTNPQRLPREVWIGSVSMMGLQAADSKDMVQKTLNIMKAIVPFKPDIICLPETFAYTNNQQKFSIQEVAEKVPGPFLTPFLNFARTHQCYVICPTYTRQDDNIYISAMLIDRAGKMIGEYRKIRPAENEIESGVRPGPIDPPVFETDFGKIGIQICFDIKWDDGWQKLKEKGAEIVFWPSAYAGGREVNSRAWRHQLYVVSSTQKDTAKICDVTGEVVAQTGRWQPNWTCAPVNLEKAFLLTWPAVTYFGKIQEKYGRRISLTTFDEEEWTIIESLDSTLKVADILTEFQLVSQHQLLKNITAAQAKNR